MERWRLCLAKYTAAGEMHTMISAYVWPLLFSQTPSAPEDMLTRNTRSSSSQMREIFGLTTEMPTTCDVIALALRLLQDETTCMLRVRGLVSLLWKIILIWYYNTVRNRMPNWPLIGAPGVVQPTSSPRPRSMSLPVRHTEFGYLILSGDDCRQGQSASGEENSV
jgi:hypothetical protein